MNSILLGFISSAPFQAQYIEPLFFSAALSSFHFIHEVYARCYRPATVPLHNIMCPIRKNSCRAVDSFDACFFFLVVVCCFLSPTVFIRWIHHLRHMYIYIYNTEIGKVNRMNVYASHSDSMSSRMRVSTIHSMDVCALNRIHNVIALQ